MSFGLLQIVYPLKIIEDIKKGKQIKLTEIAKTGMVLQFYTDDIEYYNDLNSIFANICSRFVVMDLDLIETQFARSCEIWRNSGNKNLDVDTTINLFCCICIIKEFFINQQKLLFHDSLTVSVPNNPELGESHFVLYSSHEDLIKNKIDLYWSKMKSTISKHFRSNKEKKNRRPLPKGIRHEVFKRDGFRCVECGLDNTKTTLHVDHILPLSKDGTDEMSNLRTLCDKCNLEKSDLAHGDKQ